MNYFPNDAGKLAISELSKIATFFSQISKQQQIEGECKEKAPEEEKNSKHEREFVSKVETKGMLQMGETDEHQVAQVLLEDHYSDNSLEEVELSHRLADLIVSEKVKYSM